MLFSGIVKDRSMVVCELTDGKLRTIYDLLKDSSITKIYPNLYLTSSTLDMPYLVCEDAVDFSSVFDLLDSDEMPSEEILTSIKDALYEAFGYEIDFYKNLYVGLSELKKYFKETKVEIDFPMVNYENFRETKDLVDRVNKTVGSFSVTDNKTLFRDNENSELFIMVPSPDSLAFSDDVTSFIPSMKNVFVPFKIPELYGHNYKNYLKNNSITIEMVLGDPNNNNFEIYPEEKRYYDALVALHNSLMEREHPNNTLEDCVKYNEYSELFKSYIQYMLVEVLRYHRNQSGYISLNSYVNDDDGDEESEKSGDEMTINLFYSSNKKDKIDGEEVIISLLEDQIKKDCYAPINMLIQALRFGSKLPSKLELADKRFFDIKDFTYSNLSGSFASYDVAKTAKGNNYTVVGVVNNNNKIVDTEYSRSIGFTRPKLDSPVGLILKKGFLNSDEYQLTLISFVDLVNFLGVDESLTIDGLSMINGSIRVDESVLPSNLLDNSMSLDEVITRLNYPSFVSYINPYMKGDYMECGCFNNGLSTLEIFKNSLSMVNLKQLNIFLVVSKDDVYDKVRTYTLSPEYLLGCTVSYYLLDLITKADQKIYDLSMTKFEYSISDVIAIYSQQVDSCNYPLGVYSTEITKPRNSNDNSSTSTNETASGNTSMNGTARMNGTTSANPSMANSNVFGGDSKTSSASNSHGNSTIESPSNSNNEEGGNMYNLDNLFYKGEFSSAIKVVLPNDVVDKVNLTYRELNKPFQVKSLSTSDALTVVGYLTQVNGAYVFLKPSEVTCPTKGKFTLTKLKSNILSILRTVASGEVPNVKFDSLESLDYYCKILEKC